MNRENIILTEEDGEFALTIMYPMSGEHSGRLFVLYEDSLGDVDFKIMTPDAIIKNYGVSSEEIKEFVETQENKKS